jgi:hypothetical protein
MRLTDHITLNFKAVHSVGAYIGKLKEVYVLVLRKQLFGSNEGEGRWSNYLYQQTLCRNNQTAVDKIGALRNYLLHDMALSSVFS